jgi:hypothetical protein
LSKEDKIILLMLNKLTTNSTLVWNTKWECNDYPYKIYKNNKVNTDINYAILDKIL